MAKVINSFQDKETGVVYHPGDNYNGDRVDELVGLGFLEAEKAKKKSAKKDKAADDK